MSRPLAGLLILIAEDEPLIALEMTLAFEDEGALVIRAHTLQEALAGIEDPKLSAAVLDHALSDVDTSAVCERMKELNIPFVMYSGQDRLAGAGRDVVHIWKPVGMPTLVEIVQRAIAERQTSSPQPMKRTKGLASSDSTRRTLHLTYSGGR